MRVIIPSSGNTLKILGEAKKSDSGYRLMTYVVTKKVDEGWLLFHVLTREFLLLTNDEYEHLYDIPEMYEKWFIVPEGMDDMKYADNVRFVLKTLKKKPKHITSYTIFTTTDCNARCFYCYEMGRSRIPMSEETAHKVADYIEKNCGGETVGLHWFGGEPLFNKGVIDIICNDLIDKKIDYYSTMTSNGYLFDDETVKRAENLWKLRNVQITLDGTEDVYNRCKAYIYKDVKSPYQIVLSNIKRLLDAKIAVLVRMNIDKHNADDLLKLTEELHERFTGYNNLSAYSHILFEFSTNKKRTDEIRKIIFERQRQLHDKLREYKLMQYKGLSKNLPLNLCMADNGYSHTILPNGEVGLCEHYSEEGFIGNIDTGVTGTDMVQLFCKNKEKQVECATCASYPECIRLEKCADQERCFPENQEERKQEILSNMQFTYEYWKQRKEPEEEDMQEPC